MKEKNMTLKLNKNVNMMIPAYILSVLLSMTVLAIFDIGLFSIWLVEVLLVTFMAFAICHNAIIHRKTGWFFVVLFIAAVMFFYFYLTRASDWGFAFRQWFLTGGAAGEARVEYVVAVALAFSMFFGVVIFYFSQVLFRFFFIVLVSLIPFVMHVKMLSDVDFVYPVLVAAGILGVYAVWHKKMVKQAQISGKRFTIILYAAFVAIIGAVSLIFTQKTTTRYYYVFENLFMGGSISVAVPESFSNLTDYSGNADNYNELANRKLYTVYGDGENVYLKTQTFDYYDWEMKAWYKDDEYSVDAKESGAFLSHREKLKLEDLYAAIFLTARSDKDFQEKYGLDKFLDKKIEVDSCRIEVESENFASVSIPAPWGVFRLSSYDGVYATPNCAFFREELPDSVYSSDSVSFYDNQKAARKWISAGGANLSDEEALSLLKEVKAVTAYTTWEDVTDAFIEQHEQAMAYDEKTSANTEKIPDSIKKLAEDITKDCTYDCEKAKAIEDYFHNGQFTYDLEYRAPDKSPEYFLFTSRTGTCSDFATAYVLLARSAGLNVRYVEGFVPSEDQFGENYVIKMSDSHAYPEVFIQNLGYVVFEPTISSNDMSFDMSGLGMYMYGGYYLASRVVAVVFFAGIVIFILIVLSPKIRELFFAIKVLFASPADKIVLYYGRMVKFAQKTEQSDFTHFTPNELRDWAMNTLLCDIESIAGSLNQVVYARKTSISRETIKHAKKEYHLFRKNLRKAGKKKKAKKRRKKIR